MTLLFIYTQINFVFQMLLWMRTMYVTWDYKTYDKKEKNYNKMLCLKCRLYFKVFVTKSLMTQTRLQEHIVGLYVSVFSLSIRLELKSSRSYLYVLTFRSRVPTRYSIPTLVSLCTLFPTPTPIDIMNTSGRNVCQGSYN